MGFQDKSIQCSDCGNTFTFTADEQETFASRGYKNEPKRCSQCREARKTERQGNGDYRYANRREMFPAVCAQCGQSTQVPFQPRDNRPVYCSACYNKVRVSR
jgi:CxxC-x17-CxxC domain-containing protein